MRPPAAHSQLQRTRHDTCNSGSRLRLWRFRTPACMHAHACAGAPPPGAATRASPVTPHACRACGGARLQHMWRGTSRGGGGACAAGRGARTATAPSRHP